jgi:hypothetical protein
MAPAADQPATTSDQAGLWLAVSAAHGVLERRRRFYMENEAEVRLGDQLALLPMLHDWIAVSALEANQLASLLATYALASVEVEIDRSAATAGDNVRTMARNRARATPPRTQDAC